ncbi:KOW motif-containing protein [Grimontia marina]|uniref:KOW domain-containing protein n=1 Tax=Grimontia marina TaxID=646534 RepID=A0A128FH20_9GAMM|nr:KOW motif-containing protein [Grimontia marina]CZF85556.1 hypothetical protein GMA8713_03608 [Grimontia marina]
MLDQSLIEDAFYSGKRTLDVPFVINDAVLVLSGKHAGTEGAVISYDLDVAQVVYIVETGSGEDIRVTKTDIRLCD